MGTTSQLPREAMTTGQKRELRKRYSEALDELMLSRAFAQDSLGSPDLTKLLKAAILQTSVPKIFKFAGVIEIPETEIARTEDCPADTVAEQYDAKIGWSKKFQEVLVENEDFTLQVTATCLRAYQLQEESYEMTVIDELGGEQQVAVTVPQIMWMMLTQNNGQKGILSTGDGNYFWVFDSSGKLWNVYVIWCRKHWFIDAYPIQKHSEIFALGQIFSG